MSSNEVSGSFTLKPFRIASSEGNVITPRQFFGLLYDRSGRRIQFAIEQAGRATVPARIARA